MKILFENCKVFDSSNRIFKQRSILVSDGIILDLLRHTDRRPDVDSVIDCGSRQVIPGLIDIHTHGRAGADFNTADADDMRNMAKSYSEYGVTSVFPTLASAEFESLCSQAELIDSLKGDTDGAEFLGVHLEGRYLNPSKGGAHNPDLLVLPNASELEEFAEYSKLPLRVSAAYELEGGDAFAEKAKELGATLSLAHTAATYGEAKEIYRKHKVAFTHLYNCMPPIHHRDGGTVLAAFESGGFCELICDGHHISPEMVAFTYRMIGMDRLVLISDSMEATALSDGEYSIAGLPVYVKDGVARTASGNLAGSTLSLVHGVENLAKFANIPIEDALICATLTPARAVGLENKVGKLAVGNRADFIIASVSGKHIEIDQVFVGGEEVF
ncbi:MAG: N-acetylglucosamine-6-phosphate deacetylase [Clostridia bacterium]|nr:N-acetylglucosamine-6-phosphate deacetylase [Clostridia bacterium]